MDRRGYTGRRQTKLLIPHRCPILIHNQNIFAPKAPVKGYKYFSSSKVILLGKNADNQKFQAIFQRIKYLKRLNIPMPLAVTRPFIMAKKLKSLRKTINEYHNIHSYLLGRIKSASKLEEFHKRALGTCRLISEIFLTKTTPLHALRYQRKLQILRTAFLESTALKGINENMLELIPDLRGLKSLFIRVMFITFADLTQLFESIAVRSKLEEFQLAIYQYPGVSPDFSGQKLQVKRIKILLTDTANPVDGLIKGLAKIPNVEEIKVTRSGGLKLQEFGDFNKIAKVLSDCGVVGIQTVPEGYDCKNIKLEDERFKLDVTENDFHFIRK